MSGTTCTSLERRHDLDWLRVIAIVLLVFFHAGMPFVPEWGWHLKNAERSHLLLEINFFMSRWRMALLFLVSGVGTAYALRRRSPAVFARERAKRLLVPLVFGIVVIVPPQVYMERLAGGASYASYLEFLPSIFTTGTYPEGNLGWHHLWFVAYLAGYTAILLPFFAWLRDERLRRAGAAVDRLAARVGLPAFALPLAATLVLLLPHFPGPQDVIHDLAMLLYYMIFFTYGYLFADAPALWKRITDQRARSLRWAMLSMLAVNYFRWNGADPRIGLTPAGAAYGALLALSAWCWVLAFLGYGRRYLSRGGPFLTWANEGAYPVYILHQTVTVVLAYYVLPLADGVFAKFLFLALLTLVISVAGYHLLVRPSRILRPLFGMKPLPSPARRVDARGLPAFAPAQVVMAPVGAREVASWGAE